MSHQCSFAWADLWGSSRISILITSVGILTRSRGGSMIIGLYIEAWERVHSLNEEIWCQGQCSRVRSTLATAAWSYQPSFKFKLINLSIRWRYSTVAARMFLRVILKLVFRKRNGSPVIPPLPIGFMLWWSHPQHFPIKVGSILSNVLDASLV